MKSFLLLLSIVSFLGAKDFCIVAFSLPTAHAEDEKVFLTRYPTGGAIEKYHNLYEYKIYTDRSYSDSKTLLSQVKKHYKGAFLINCSPRVTTTKNVKVIVPKTIKAKTPIKKHTMLVTKPATKKVAQIEKPDNVIPIIKPFIKQEESHKHLAVDAKKIAYSDETPLLDEPTILEAHQIPDPYKTDVKQYYDTLNLQNYMEALFEHNKHVDEAYYQQKIDSLMVEIRKDYFNFDIYTDGYIRTGRSVPAQGNGVNVSGDYTGAGIALNANKVLWNGHYNLVNNVYDVLNNRLAEIQELNAKEKLAILGVTLYTSLYYSQDKLHILEALYKKQSEVTELVKSGYKIGKTSVIAHLDAQNDLLNLKKDLLRLREVHRKNSYILRHSIESKSTKSFKLSEPIIDLKLDSLVKVEREALKNSSDIALASNNLQVSKADLLFQKRRFYPEIKFNSFIGYGLGSLENFDYSHSGSGEYWELGLEFQMPIYNRNDIRLNEQREVYEVMKKKATFSLKQREILIQVDNYYNTITRVVNEKKIVHQQTELMGQKMSAAKEQFAMGIIPYSTYSDSIKDYLTYQDEFINMQQQYMQNLSILSVIIGKKSFYE